MTPHRRARAVAALPEEILARFRAWGRQGGEARRRALSATERSAQARKAVAARWNRQRQAPAAIGKRGQRV